jgi:hypothetical protein
MLRPHSPDNGLNKHPSNADNVLPDWTVQFPRSFHLHTRDRQNLKSHLYVSLLNFSYSSIWEIVVGMITVRKRLTGYKSYVWDYALFLLFLSLMCGKEKNVLYKAAVHKAISAVLFRCVNMYLLKKKVKQSLYTPWRRLGGKEV